MGDPSTKLNVSLRDLSTVHTAYIRCLAQEDQSQFGQVIRASFQRLQQWVKELGIHPYTQLTIGVIHSVNGKLSHYDCCVQVPANTPAILEAITLQDLPGGRFAVLEIEKDPAIIGPTIGRFYQEYLPQSSLQVDPQRSPYEIYFERTMEYCVPLSEYNIMNIDLARLNFTFTTPPLLIGGKAMEFYNLRPAGADVDFVITAEDYYRLAQQYPDHLKEIWGDLGVCVFEFEIWKSICLFDYAFLAPGALEQEGYHVISLEKLLFLKALGMKVDKYHHDLELLVERMLHDRYEIYYKK